MFIVKKLSRHCCAIASGKTTKQSGRVKSGGVILPCFNCPSAMAKAFSLIEMLMALLVASLLLAALAPVMTKKMTENVNVTGGNSTFTVPPCVYINDTVADHDGLECVIPPNIYSVGAIIASGGGGGGGAADKVYDGKELIQEFKAGVSTAPIVNTASSGHCNSGNTNEQYDYFTFEITKDMSDIWVELIGGGGGGGGGNTNLGGYPGQQSDCGGSAVSAGSSWGMYIAPEYNGTDGHGTCVSKFNPSDGGKSPSIPSSVQVYNTGDKAAKNDTKCTVNANCCYKGTMTDANYCDTANGSYSGCTRTNCQWNAAYTICDSWKPVTTAGATKGRLPSKEELTGWNANFYKISGNLGNDGLQFCLWSKDNVYIGHSSKCIEYVSSDALGCYGMGEGADQRSACNTRYIWSNDKYGDNAHISAEGAAGSNPLYTRLTYGYDDRAARTTRCVIDKISEFKAYRGAGGYPAMYGKMKIPNEVLERSFEPDSSGKKTEKLVLNLQVGRGGKGALGYGNGNQAGCYSQQGNRTTADLYRANSNGSIYGNILWEFQVVGGQQGGAAHSNANEDQNAVVLPEGATPGYKDWIAGSYSPNGTYPSCAYYNAFDTKFNNLNSRGIQCSKIPGAVFNIGGIPNDNGDGGGGYWNGQVAPMSKYLGTQQVNATSPGSGGAAATCTEGKTRLSPVCYNGGNGTGGAVKLTYRRSYPGAGGGGGGAGTVAHFANLAVHYGDVIKIQTGGKGLGGVVGTDGADGGSSFIELKGKKYEVTGGKGGKSGTAAVIPSAGDVVYAKGGSGGDGGAVTNETKGYMKDGDTYYPEKTADVNSAKGADAPKTLLENGSEDTHAVMAFGGNGGINTRISFTGVGTSNNRLPCGGFSKTPIKANGKEYKCEVLNYRPLLLTRILSSSEVTKSISQSYALGSTGGGGGGWDNDSYPSAASGADGMGGYVIIYFNEEIQ